MKNTMFILVALALIISSGCATHHQAAPLTMTDGPQLHVKNVGDGCVISWVSEPGKTYSVLYVESLTAPDWKPLTGYTDIPGTGQNIDVPDMAPGDSTRFYKVVVKP